MKQAKKPKPKKEPKPKLMQILIKEISTGSIICIFAPTRAGIKRAKRFEGLADVEIVKEYA